LEIRCGNPSLQRELAAVLQREGFNPRKPVILVIDAPPGFALRELRTHRLSPVVVMTENPCPEYWEDLWRLEPTVLLAGSHSLGDLMRAADRAGNGQRYRETPETDSLLSKREQAVMRLCAMGLDNQIIADRLGLSERSVRNNLDRICRKLGLENRAQVTLYYWGLWQWLERGDREASADSFVSGGS